LRSAHRLAELLGGALGQVGLGEPERLDQREMSLGADELGELPVIAEDIGFINKSVERLRRDVRPGTEPPP